MSDKGWFTVWAIAAGSAFAFFLLGTAWIGAWPTNDIKTTFERPDGRLCIVAGEYTDRLFCEETP